MDSGGGLVRLQRHERRPSDRISGLVAVNSLLAMVGGVLFALVAGKNDPGFIHNGALAGLIAVCAGSDLMHPLAAFLTGGIAAVIFVYGFKIEQEKLKIDDVLGVWPLHGICGTWGGIAAGIFGYKELGGMGGVTFVSQLMGSLAPLSLPWRAVLWSIPSSRKPSASGSTRKQNSTVPTSQSTASMPTRKIK